MQIKAFNVAGVGNGTQSCKFGIHSPIAVEHTDDQVHQHTVEATIVEGLGGRQLPGLLGLRSLERHRCILDCGERQLHFVSDGDVEIKLPSALPPYPWKKYHPDIWLWSLIVTSASKHVKVEYQQHRCNYMQICRNTWKVIQALKIQK